MRSITLPTAMKGAGTLLKTAAIMRAGKISAAEGKGVSQAKEVERAGLRRRAGQERAASQREAAEIRRDEKFLQSEFQAREAASGAIGTGRIPQEIAEEGAFRTALALFSGEEVARGLEDIGELRGFEGSIAVSKGRREERAARLKALSTLLGSLS